MLHKHSLSVPTVPASAPASPACARIIRREPLFGAPVTPQRLVRPQKVSHRSPVTPASTYSTPYTPLSLRSLSTASSSSITTPGSASSFKRCGISPSAENNVTSHLVNKDLADIAENWRSRANENGIKVSNADDSIYGDDEASNLAHSGMNSTGFVNGEALLPPPFLSLHRRCQTISSTAPHSPLSPHMLQTPARRALGELNTPPPKPTNVSQLKFKGSFTDPAHTRRRPSFGQTSTELFDIDENTFEPYPQSFPSAEPFALHDPFNGPGLPTISESVQQYFGESFFHGNMQSSATATPSTACSVCGRDGGRIAILRPCDHPLCSGCLTSALNIVGEKAMQCAVCKEPVANFRLQTAPSCANSLLSSPTQQSASQSNFASADAFVSPLQRRTVRPLLPSFERTVFAPHTDQFTGQFQRGLSPPNFVSAPKQGVDNVVLRIDNVPWDITPPAICAWLKQPVVRVHVLLDQRGKTLSHAFVELATEEYARAALRGAQNSVLGSGKRARGVTVTRSSQEELMRALFPSWKGGFEGSRPSLAGLRNDQIKSALEIGIMADVELQALMRLVHSPDSHFVKVPSLPYHFLISILSKFPMNVDGVMSCSNVLRDNLFNLTYKALYVLATGMGNKIMEGPRLLEDLLQAGVACQAFTPQQSQMLSSCGGRQTTPFLPAHLPGGHLRADSGVVIRDDGSILAPYATLSAPMPHNAIPASGLYNDIAREFNVDEDLIQKLAQRLLL